MARKGITPVLAPSDRGLVVFMFWKSLAYERRLLLSLGLIMMGLVLQFAAGLFFDGVNVTAQFAAGAVPIIMGASLLLVKGYDNRVDAGRLDPAANWQAVERSKLAELRELDRKIRKWDTSALDVTNVIGAMLFFAVIVILAILAVILTGLGRIFALDAILLVFPQWITGIKRILVLPGMIVKVDALSLVLGQTAAALEGDKVEVMMLLKGKEKRLPDDVKFRVSLKGADPDFLGFYGQVVINLVQGKSYPYFYVVLVAKKGFGLQAEYDAWEPPAGVTKEFGEDGEVEFIVVRQATTSTSGYHTTPEAALGIMSNGLLLARNAAAGNPHNQAK